MWQVALVRIWTSILACPSAAIALEALAQSGLVNQRSEVRFPQAASLHNLIFTTILYLYIWIQTKNIYSLFKWEEREREREKEREREREIEKEREKRKKPYSITLITCNSTLVCIIDYLLGPVLGILMLKLSIIKCYWDGNGCWLLL